MILGIDAFNLKDGGGLTHLVELLKVAKPSDYGFKHVVVWGDKKLLLQIDDRPWLIKENKDILEKALKQDNLLVLSPPIRASYNSPFTLPILKRNEVMYKVDL